MKTKQKIVKTMLSFFNKAMILAALCWAANADAGVTGRRIPGTNTIEVTGYSNGSGLLIGADEPDGIVRIPETGKLLENGVVVGPFPVVGIADGAVMDPAEIIGINGYVIPASITYIGDFAFRGAKLPDGIKIEGNSLVRIGKQAFFGGQAPDRIPSSVRIIEDDAFKASPIKNIDMSEVTHLGTGVFSGCAELTEAVLPVNMKSIPDMTFYSCAKLTDVTMPPNVDSIGVMAFINCTSLKNINLAGVSYIAHDAFRKTAVEELVIPASVAFVDYDAFRECASLKKLSVLGSGNWIPSGIFFSTAIEELYWERKNVPDDFANTLTKITLANSVETIGSRAFWKCPITEITFPASTVSIGSDAFAECKLLTQVSIPATVTSLGNRAFGGCPALKEVKFEDGDSEITLGNTVFNQCPLESFYWGRHNLPGGMFFRVTSLKNITLGQYVRSIGVSAFEECYGLTGIAFPASLKTVGNRAFHDCPGLKGKIELPAALESIGEWAFEDCPGITKVNIPGTVTAIGYGAFLNTRITHLTFDAGEENFTKGSNIFAGCSLDTVYWYRKYIPDNMLQGVKTIKKLVLGEGVAHAGKSVFAGCTGITEISLPNTLVSIGSSAFQGCTAPMVLPLCPSLESIGSSAFAGCTGLTEAPMPQTVTSIGSSAFAECTGLTEFVIPAALTALENYVFNKCSGIKEFSIPSSIASIGSYAFASCTGLQELTVKWETPLTVSNDVFSGLTAGNIKLTVPDGTGAAYKAANVWKNFKIEEDKISSATFPMFKLPATVSVGTSIKFQVAGENSDKLTVFKVNGAATETFTPATAGKYLLEALSSDGKLKIYKYITVN